MPRAGRDEEFLASQRAMGHACDLELHLLLDDHDDLVRVVDAVRPDLAWRVGPKATREATHPPQSAATAFRSTGVVMTRIMTKAPRSWQRCVTLPRHSRAPGDQAGADR